jgi:hypothetical protein
MWTLTVEAAGSYLGYVAGYNILTGACGWFLSVVHTSSQIIPNRRLLNCVQHILGQMLHISMEVSPSTEANSSSATQEIPHSLWKTNAHNSPLLALILRHHIPVFTSPSHNSPLLALILHHHIPVFTSPSHNFNTYFPIVLSSTPKISKLSVSFKFCQQTLFLPPVAKLHPYHPVWFGNPHDARI